MLVRFIGAHFLEVSWRVDLGSFVERELVCVKALGVFLLALEDLVDAQANLNIALLVKENLRQL